MNKPSQRTATLFICFALFVTTFATFWPLLKADFVNFDDPHYVTGNDFVRSGLSLDNIKRAFTTAHSANWHPLTWVSHMLDCELFGLKPGGHHFTNILLHAANSALLFLLLQRLTGSRWRSAMVAGLFCLHPLHVESVAWISERKDLLSGFFFMLAIYSYVLCVEQKREMQRNHFAAYGASLLFFACGLMSKPMLVTLPFLLLLLDWWPLKRFVPATGSHPVRSVLMEKLPFVALTIASCVITFFAQKTEGAVRSVEEFTLAHRFGNTAVAYLEYLRKTAWPSDLAAFYPHANWPSWRIGLGVIVVASVSLLAIRRRHSQPWIAIGWFWFLGMLVPVIGLVQVGEQAWADRYTYLPLIGIFIATVWSIHELARVQKVSVAAVRSVAVIAVLVCSGLSFRQAQHWKTTETLFSHATRVTKNNYLALNHLSTELVLQNRYTEAEKYLTEAVALRPQFHDAQLSLGNVYAMQGRLDEAIVHFTEAVKIDPESDQAHYNLGNALKTKGDVATAMQHFEQALQINRDNADAHSNLGILFARQNNMQAAAEHFARVVALRPQNADARFNLAMALANIGEVKQAMQHYEQVIALRPDFAQAHFQLALLRQSSGDREQAIHHLREAIRLNPDFEDARRQLAAMTTAAE